MHPNINNIRNGKKDGLWHEYYHSKTLLDVLIAEGTYQDGIKEGFWREYYTPSVFVESSNNRVKNEGVYKNGKRVGPWKGYYESGALEWEMTYKDDYTEIAFCSFYKNGKTREEGKLQNGIKEGWWKRYFSHGKLESEGNYTNGKMDGMWRYYYEIGQLKSEGNYVNREDNLKCSILVNRNKNDGNGLTSIFTGEREIKRTQVDIGKDGLWKEYSEEGELKSERIYRNGKQME